MHMYVQLVHASRSSKVLKVKCNLATTSNNNYTNN